MDGDEKREARRKDAKGLVVSRTIQKKGEANDLWGKRPQENREHQAQQTGNAEREEKI